MDTSRSRQTQNVDLGAFRAGRYYWVVSFGFKETESLLLQSSVNGEDGVVFQQAPTRQVRKWGKLIE